MSIAKIVVVCTGNICRSPMAEVVLRDRLAEAGIGATVASSGVSDEEAGNPIDDRAADALDQRGYVVPTRKARWAFDGDDLEADLILAMTTRHRDALVARGADPDSVRLWMEFVPGDSRHDVTDPWYGDREGFEEILDLIEAGADRIVDLVGASQNP